VSLAGFVIMAFSISLRRMTKAGAPLCISLMGVGTALVFIGIYAGSMSN